MSTSQSGKNVVVAYAVESVYNTAPGTGGGKQLRIDASPGMSLKRALIQNPEVRSDSLSSMARLGSRMADGSYNVPITVGGLDTILEAVMRSTWVAATAITQATAGLTSISVPTTSTILASAGSWITAGVKKGDVFTLASFNTTADDAINLRVKNVTASTITVYGTPLTIDAALDTTFTLTVMKKLKNGATATKRTFYIEEYNQDIDVSEVFGGCKFIGLDISGSPDGTATAVVKVLGASGAVLASGSSPYYISPTLNTAIRLVFADASLAYNGSDVATCTGFQINYTVAAKTEPVVGSSVSPDIFDNDATLTGSLSFVRADLANVTQFINETELELHVLLVEPTSEPKSCLALYIPRVKLTAADASLGSDGPMVETLPFTCGKSESVTGVDDTLLTISTSAA